MNPHVSVEFVIVNFVILCQRRVTTKLPGVVIVFNKSEMFPGELNRSIRGLNLQNKAELLQFKKY